MGNSLAGGINMDFFFEFIVNNSGGMKMLGGIIFVVSLLYGGISLFISGGAISLMVRKERWNSSLFWGDSAKYFGRLLRLFLLSIPVFIIFYLVQFIELAIVRIFFGSDPYENVKFWGAIIRIGIGYLGILVYYMILDYAKIYAIKNDERNMSKALWKSIIFTMKNFFTTFSLACSFFIIGVVALLLFKVTSEFVSGSQALMILFLIILQQMYLAFKMFIKLMLYSSQTMLYFKLMPVDLIVSAQPVEQTDATEDMSRLETAL
ncbi:MAG: hypothetical protein EPO24_05895 [Bacteroidetes bacterium]|nr:MAG: hypothetical protein EPO24_05895 [Bacteroidota bacterium]